MNETLLERLNEWLRIPSISSGGGDPADLQRAADWAKAYIAEAGGEATVHQTEANPLVVGELRSSKQDAPTVLIYGHYDVQSADPVEAWTSPPFEPTIRDGRLYARGAADDKGNFFPLLYVACEMAREGTLPVHVRVLLEGEEEIGGDSAVDWVAQDERGADCAIVFDSEMLDENTPALTLGVRGIVQMAISVTTAPRDLHSGMYGGSVLNAVHVMHSILAKVMPDEQGRLRDELREGILEPSAEELESWKRLPPGAHVLGEVGGRPLSSESAPQYYPRNWADASLDCNGIMGGDAVQIRTIVPAGARAVVSMRLAPGQSVARMTEVLQGLLLSDVPEGAEVTLSKPSTGEPAVFDPSDAPIAAAARALEKACSAPAALIRSGGSIPVLAAFAQRKIPVILSGFTLAQDAFHAPDESFRLESLRLGEASARALYEELGTLP